MRNSLGSLPHTLKQTSHSSQIKAAGTKKEEQIPRREPGGLHRFNFSTDKKKKQQQNPEKLP